MRNPDPHEQWKDHLRRVARRRSADSAAEVKPLRLVKEEISRVTVRGRRESKDCAIDHETGELHCLHLGKAPPRDDCRQIYCPHFPIMHQRRIGHARTELARKRKVRGAQ